MEEISQKKLINLVNNSLKIVGVKQVLKAIIFSFADVRCVVLAKDADKEVINPIIDLCKQKQIQVYFVSNKRALGNLVGIDVAASSLALKK